MHDDQELLDIKQAAEFLKVSETSLRRWTNAGRLACLRVGHRRERRFRRQDLLSFMEHQPAGDSPPALGAVSESFPGRGETIIGGTPIAHGAHLCGFYATNTERADLVAGFLLDGLHSDSVCCFVGGRDAQAEILARLARDHPSLDAEIDAGRIIVSEYHGSTRAQYEFFETRFTPTAETHPSSIRVVGDVCGFETKTSWKVVADYENGFSARIAKRFPVVTLCLYDVRYFSSSQMLSALKSHEDTLRYPPQLTMA